MFIFQSTIPVQNKTAVFITKPCCTADFQITSDKMSLKKVLREFRPWKPSLVFAELHFVFLSRSNFPFISTFLEGLTKVLSFYPRVEFESFVLGTPSLIKLYFKNYSDLEFYLCKYAVYLFAIHLNEKKVSKREVLYQAVPSLNFVKINLCTYNFVFVKILSSISPKVSLQFTQ